MTANPAPTDGASVHGQGAGGVPRHVAIIMDGNGRWAAKRGLPRVAGHRAGAEAVRKTLKAAVKAGIEVLTIYAFSSENWRRSEEEVSDLKGLLGYYLERELEELAREGVRLRLIGHPVAFGPQLVERPGFAVALEPTGDRVHTLERRCGLGRCQVDARQARGGVVVGRQTHPALINRPLRALARGVRIGGQDCFEQAGAQLAGGPFLCGRQQFDRDLTSRPVSDAHEDVGEDASPVQADQPVGQGREHLGEPVDQIAGQGDFPLSDHPGQMQSESHLVCVETDTYGGRRHPGHGIQQQSLFMSDPPSDATYRINRAAVDHASTLDKGYDSRPQNRSDLAFRTSSEVLSYRARMVQVF